MLSNSISTFAFSYNNMSVFINPKTAPTIHQKKESTNQSYTTPTTSQKKPIYGSNERIKILGTTASQASCVNYSKLIRGGGGNLVTVSIANSAEATAAKLRAA
jgi:hypothetical protein